MSIGVWSTLPIFLPIHLHGSLQVCKTEFATLHVLHSKHPKNERNKTRLILASNRGSLVVPWTYSGSGVVLSWDLTHKNTQTSTQAHACRVTDTDPSSLDTNTRGSPTVRV